MSEINMQISVTQLTQIDRHQNDAHRTPTVHQEQNMQASQQEAAHRLNMPVQPDVIEKKKVDRGIKRGDGNERRKKRPRHQVEKEHLASSTDGGSSLIDLRV